MKKQKALKSILIVISALVCAFAIGLFIFWGVTDRCSCDAGTGTEQNADGSGGGTGDGQSSGGHGGLVNGGDYDAK